VVVSLAGGRRLSPGQVQSIAYLVSSSVKNMKPEYVTIVDEKGTLLYSPEFAEGGAGPGNLQMKLSFQRELETRVQGMLDNVFGMGKAVVKVAVEFEQDRRTIETEMFEPPDRNLGNLRSMQEKSEGYGESGETKAAIAVPGGPSGTQSYSNKNIIKNYELNRRKEQRVVASDKIKRITAGVFLDSSVRLDETGRKDILKVLETSIGINRARGDTITICPLAFNNDYWKEQKSAMKEEEQRQRIFTLIRLASPAFAVLVFIAFYLILLRNMRKMKASLPARGGRETPLMLKEGLAPLSAFSRPGGEFPDLQRSGLMPPHMAVSEEERIRRLALEDPDRIAKVLETLLVEAEKEKDHAAAH
jgi:flagellar M-ring protein FliF